MWQIVVRSAGFYADMLGFDIGTLSPDDSPQFAILSREGRRLQLSRRAGTPVPASPPACTLWLDVAGVRDLHAALNTSQTPLNRLGEAELCPGSAVLAKINAGLR